MWKLLAAAMLLSAAAYAQSSNDFGIKEKLRRCWTPLSHSKVVVTVFVRMNRDGTPSSAEVSERRDDAEFRAMADAAQKAVMNKKCRPWRLPPEKYEDWKTLSLVFDPN